MHSSLVYSSKHTTILQTFSIVLQPKILITLNRVLQTKPHQFSDIENLKKSKNIKRREGGGKSISIIHTEKKNYVVGKEQNYDDPTAEVAAW